MLTRKGSRVKVVTASDGFNFETKLNAFLDDLDAKGISYTYEFNHNAPHTAYITYDHIYTVCESVRDEYEEVGETHTCIECPYYVRPTDGRRKYTRCNKTDKLCKGDDRCCDRFYEELDKGMLQIVRVG